jgi:hypothetical protein
LRAVVGAGLLFAFGTGGKLDLGPSQLATKTSAIVSPVASIKNTSIASAVLGKQTVSLAVSPVPGTRAVFVGIARAADADRYLAGVARQQVTDLGIDSLGGNALIHGRRAVLAPPASERFWVAKASSTSTAKLNWRVRDGQYTVVIMSANGRPGFATTTALAFEAPNVPLYSLAMLLVGLMVLAAGTTLIVRVSRRAESASSADRAPGDPAATTA